MARLCTLACLFSLILESRAEDFSFFESKIRPVLTEHCYECHSVNSGKSKGDLLLDSRAAIRKGGGSGPAIVPGDIEASLLLAVIRHEIADLEMPPRKAKLADSVIGDFKTWIESGAPDPRDGSPPKSTHTNLEAARNFWAFVAPKNHAVPAFENSTWPKSVIDHFILEKLEENRLQPSADATPSILLRRLYFDLTGLPPSPVASDKFLETAKTHGIDHAIETTVDQLLASPRYGERWARHWMDVVRFAESSGKDSNLTFPHAWRYRDYAIDAFNDDLAYDRFITEQLAGDLLPYENAEERARLLIATSYLAFGTKNLNEMNPAQFAADLVDEQIDTVTRSLLAQSIACSRCHDHKFDAFPMEDYYALAGIFRSTKTYYGTWIDSENSVGGDLITLPKIPDQLIPNRSMSVEKVAELHAKLAKLEEEKKAGVKTLRDAIRIIWQTGGIEGKLETVDEQGKALPLTMGTMDREEIVEATLFERGEVSKPGKTIPRRFPAVFTVPGSPPGNQSSGRLELANWITHPEHPLTARVMANRIWKSIFGYGLVRSTDNFGSSGQQPSHPKLLDHLAISFRDNHWSIKSLIRQICLSRTYRQSSTWQQEAFLIDPENRLLWRHHKKRLEAEAIRDSMLAASARLDLSRRPGSLVADLKSQSVGLVAFNRALPADLDGCRYRSIYLPVMRDRLPDVLELFDFAEPSLVTGQRDQTNVPVQSLYLMNSPFVIEQAGALAKRIESPSVRETITKLYQITLSRKPDESEIQFATTFLKQHQSLPALCQAIFSTSEFRNLD